MSIISFGKKSLWIQLGLIVLLLVETMGNTDAAFVINESSTSDAPPPSRDQLTSLSTTASATTTTSIATTTTTTKEASRKERIENSIDAFTSPSTATMQMLPQEDSDGTTGNNRRLPGNDYNFDFDGMENLEMGMLLTIGIIILLCILCCCCCCGRGGGCSLWDLLAVYCCFELCCDDTPDLCFSPMDDLGGGIC